MGEGGGVHAALVLELEEEAVAAAAREDRLERDRPAGRGAVTGVGAAVPGASTSGVRVDVCEVSSRSATRWPLAAR
jgi:hypothetical protein